MTSCLKHLSISLLSLFWSGGRRLACIPLHILNATQTMSLQLEQLGIKISFRVKSDIEKNPTWCQEKPSATRVRSHGPPPHRGSGVSWPVCFGWRACWLVSGAVNQSLPDGQDPNLSPVCHYPSTSQILLLLSSQPGLNKDPGAHTDPHRPRVHSEASLGGLLEAGEEQGHTCWT